MAGDWIAYRLAVLCADSRGVVRGGTVVHDRAVRVALLIDLALRGRIQFDADRNYVDTSPTGYAPADALLQHIVAHPDQSMAALFVSAKVGLIDVLDPTRAAAGSIRRNRAVTLDPVLMAQEKDRVRSVAQSGIPDSPATAALAVLAGVLGLAVSDHRASLIAQCGSARNVLADCCTYLGQLMTKFALIAALPASTSGG